MSAGPGWYLDDAAARRWWDGARWTEHVAIQSGPEAAADPWTLPGSSGQGAPAAPRNPIGPPPEDLAGVRAFTPQPEPTWSQRQPPRQSPAAVAQERERSNGRVWLVIRIVFAVTLFAWAALGVGCSYLLPYFER